MDLTSSWSLLNLIELIPPSCLLFCLRLHNNCAVAWLGLICLGLFTQPVALVEDQLLPQKQVATEATVARKGLEQRSLSTIYSRS